MILDKASFDLKISQFFSSYLINRQTQYIWNYFILLFFRANISIRQKFALSPIFSALCIASIFHIFKKRSKSLFISQKKSYEKSDTNIFCSYNIMWSLFNQFSLVIEHNKLDIFYFLKSTKNINLPLLDLRLTENALFRPKDTWWHLGFLFNKNSLLTIYLLL